MTEFFEYVSLTTVILVLGITTPFLTGWYSQRCAEKYISLYKAEGGKVPISVISHAWFYGMKVAMATALTFVAVAYFYASYLTLTTVEEFGSAHWLLVVPPPLFVTYVAVRAWNKAREIWMKYFWRLKRVQRELRAMDRGEKIRVVEVRWP